MREETVTSYIFKSCFYIQIYLAYPDYWNIIRMPSQELDKTMRWTSQIFPFSWALTDLSSFCFLIIVGEM